MSRLNQLVRGAVGAKVVMASTGLVGVAFVVVHAGRQPAGARR